MANTKSAIKRVRRILRQTTVNKSRKSRFRLALKKMNSIIEKKDKKEAVAFLPKLNSELIRIAKTGVIKKKNLSRLLCFLDPHLMPKRLYWIIKF